MVEPTDSSIPKARRIDVRAQQIAAIYAKAFVGAAQKAGQADKLIEEFDSIISQVLDQFPDLESLLASALVSYEEKSAILDNVFGNRLSPIVLDFLKVVARKGRLNLLRAIDEQIHKYYDELSGRVKVKVVTATPINGEVTQNLADTLRGMLSGEPVLEPAVDPELIGGVVLRIGDTVYDGSIARQLEQMREQMINRSVHEIQSRRDRFRNPSGN